MPATGSEVGSFVIDRPQEQNPSSGDGIFGFFSFRSMLDAIATETTVPCMAAGVCPQRGDMQSFLAHHNLAIALAECEWANAVNVGERFRRSGYKHVRILGGWGETRA